MGASGLIYSNLLDRKGATSACSVVRKCSNCGTSWETSEDYCKTCGQINLEDVRAACIGGLVFLAVGIAGTWWSRTFGWRASFVAAAIFGTFAVAYCLRTVTKAVDIQRRWNTTRAVARENVDDRQPKKRDTTGQSEAEK